MLQLVLSALVGYLLGSLSFSIILSRLRLPGRYPPPWQRKRRYDQHAAHLWQGSRSGGVCGGFPQGQPGGGAGPSDRRRAGRLSGRLLCGHRASVPVFFGFRGGKGVATAAGMILVMSPGTLLVLLVPFVLIIVLHPLYVAGVHHRGGAVSCGDPGENAAGRLGAFKNSVGPCLLRRYRRIGDLYAPGQYRTLAPGRGKQAGQKEELKQDLSFCVHGLKAYGETERKKRRNLQFSFKKPKKYLDKAPRLYYNNKAVLVP